MESASYEQIRENAIKQIGDILREAFDECFKLSRSNGHKPTKRLRGLKQLVQVSLHYLAEQGHQTLDINDIIQQMRSHNYEVAKLIEQEPAKKASLSSLLRRLAENGDTIEVLEVGEGRRPTKYVFTDVVLSHFEEDIGFISD